VADPESPEKFTVTWSVPENVEVTLTLYRDPRRTEFEEKEWMFALEGVSQDSSVLLQVELGMLIVVF